MESYAGRYRHYIEGNRCCTGVVTPSGDARYPWRIEYYKLDDGEPLSYGMQSTVSIREMIHSRTLRLLWPDAYNLPEGL